MSYNTSMEFDWNPEKNQWLVESRDISFEEIIGLIEAGCLRAILKHKKKKHQRIFVVERDGYAFNVPFVKQEDGTCFLKTIYPSRASTNRYIGGKDEKNKAE